MMTTPLGRAHVLGKLRRAASTKETLAAAIDEIADAYRADPEIKREIMAIEKRLVR